MLIVAMPTSESLKFDFCKHSIIFELFGLCIAMGVARLLLVLWVFLTVQGELC